MSKGVARGYRELTGEMLIKRERKKGVTYVRRMLRAGDKIYILYIKRMK